MDLETMELYEMIPYSVGVRVLEGRSLISQYQTECQSFVRITIGKNVQQTKNQTGTSTAVWNQEFTFKDVKMNKLMLEQMDISLEVLQSGRWLDDDLIGSYSVGLSTLFRRENHEIYRKWVRLSLPGDPTKTTGYLQVTCYIIGPNGKLPIHGLYDNVDEDDERSENGGGADQILLNEKKIEVRGLEVIQEPFTKFKTYQLRIHIYKGENFPKWNDQSCSPYIMIKTQMCTLKSSVIQKSEKPNFNTEFLFPVYFPTYNEKIIFVIFHEGKQFLANMPEIPSYQDFANTSQLMALEGKMEPKWVNLYGVDQKDRYDTFDKKHTSSFMGRVLLSLHLNETQNPQFTKKAISIAKEPKSQHSKLWIDIYALGNVQHQKLFQLGKVYINAKILGKEMFSHSLKYQKKTRSFINTQSCIKMKEISVENMPKDKSMMPDLFLYIKPKDGKLPTEENLSEGFIRIKADEYLLKEQQPKWRRVIHMRDPTKTIGMLLMNVQHAQLEKGRFPKRVVVEKGVDQQWEFYAQILRGYEIDPSVNNENLETKVVIEINQTHQLSKPLETKYKKGSFPIYDKQFIKEQLTLESKLEFAQDIVFKVVKKDEEWLSGKSEPEIGQFAVSCISMRQLYKKPQFYNIIDVFGNIQGKILARFYIKPKDIYENKTEHNQIKKEMNELLLYKPMKVDLTLSLIGLRDLISPTAEGILKVRLEGLSKKQKQQLTTNKHQIQNQKDYKSQKKQHQQEQEHVTQSKDQLSFEVRQKTDKENENDSGDSFSPNFQSILKFSQLEVHKKEPLLWPIIVISYYQNPFDTKETFRAVLPSFIYLDQKQNIFEQKDIKISMAILMNNYKQSIQRQMNPIDVYTKVLQVQKSKIVNSSLNKAFDLKIEGQNFLAQVGDALDLISAADHEMMIVSLESGKQIDYSKIIKMKNTKAADSRRNKSLQSKQDKLNFIWNSKTSDNEEDDDDDSYECYDDFLNKQREKGLDGSKDSEDPKTHFADGGYQLLSDAAQPGTNQDMKQQKLTQNLFSMFHTYPIQPKIQLSCTPNDKDRELKEIEEQKEKERNLELELLQMEKYLESQQQKGKRDDEDILSMVKQQLAILRQRIEDLEQGVIKADFYVSFNEDGAYMEEEKFDYGQRKQLQSGVEDQIELPYETVMLTQDAVISTFSSASYIKNSCEENGLFKSGKETQAFLRFSINVQKNEAQSNKNSQETEVEQSSSDDDRHSNSDHSISDDGQPTFNQQAHGGREKNKNAKGKDKKLKKRNATDDEDLDDFDKKSDQSKSDDSDYNQHLVAVEDSKQIYEMVKKRFGFNLFEHQYLSFVASAKERNFKVRVYILTCSNLTGMISSYEDLRTQLGGYGGRSSANPYIIVKVGPESKLQDDNKRTKMINDRENAKELTLNPQFYQVFELDAVFPEDWKLRIEIRNRETSFLSENFFGDQLIGMTEIDLENRRFSYDHVMAAKIIDFQLQGQISSRNGKLSEEKIQQLDKWRKILKRNEIEDFNKQPVENRQLFNEEKTQSQGTIELWVEVLTDREAQAIPIKQIARAKKQESYEVRLIIWKTTGVPLVDDGASDIFVTGSYAPNGISNQQMQIKETSVHYRCTTGTALFNYRMKFQIDMPAEYPRINLKVFDKNNVSQNTAIGETTIDLLRAIRMFNTHGSQEPKMIWVDFTNYQTKEPAGQCLFSFQILTKQEADNNPVGNGYDQPNPENLTEPTEGRSFGERMAGFTGISLPNVGDLNPMGWVKNLVYGVVIAIAVFFVMFLVLTFK